MNPENTSETVENGLWKKFVNTQERVLNILSNLQYSQDQMSTKSTALYSIRQSSIQTMYNKNLTENFTAWGSEAIQDETLLPFETEELKRIARITISITVEKILSTCGLETKPCIGTTT